MSTIAPIKSSEIVLRQLDDKIDVSSFDCGVDDLNGYLKENAFTPHEVRGGVYRSGYARLKSKVYNNSAPQDVFRRGGAYLSAPQNGI